MPSSHCPQTWIGDLTDRCQLWVQDFAPWICFLFCEIGIIIKLTSGALYKDSFSKTTRVKIPVQGLARALCCHHSNNP